MTKNMNLCGTLWFIVAVWFLFLNLSLCCCLNEEGNALLKFKQRISGDPFGALSNWFDDQVSVDPCHWFGVECSDRKVVILNLKDLCLEGTLAPELVNLVHIKSIILRNNSFYGTIPEEIVTLQELEILDLGYNNFSGHLDANFGHNISLAILLLDNNEVLVGFSPKINELKMLSECQVDENQLINVDKMPACSQRSMKWHVHESEGPRSLLEYHKLHRHRPYHYRRNRTSPLYRSPPSDPPLPAALPPVTKPASPPNENVPDSPGENAYNSPPPLSTLDSEVPIKSMSSKKNQVPIFAGVIGCVVFLVISTIGIYLCKTNKVAIVRPWTTGISGQLQKALVTGVPKLKRTDLEAACEDFSNVIGNSPIGTLYKGTLSSGVEIAVASISVTSSKSWTKPLEAQFRKKIDTLSKVNHKNFVNLIGYCEEEEEPFTRMLVFEYAPNGTLFEHLHIKEAEHLNWGARLRIAMGMAYCLQHMHELDPPVALINLSSSTVHLTDDHAAKISDFSFSNETSSSEKKHTNMPMPSTSPASNVYSFGVLLFEIVTGRIPYTVDHSSHENWASHYLKWDKPLKEMVDPILTSYQEDQVKEISELIRVCVNPDSEKRPTMNEVSERLREITKMSPELVVPKLSPLWWAELEINQ